MIETRTALDNLDMIVDTPGIDGLVSRPVRPFHRALDGKSLDPTAKEVDHALDRMVAATQKAGKIPGAFCHPLNGLRRWKNAACAFLRS